MSKWVEVEVQTSAVYLVEVGDDEDACDVASEEIFTDDYACVDIKELGEVADVEQSKRYANKVISL